MGIKTKSINVTGVKYKIYKEVTGEDNLPDWCEDDISCALEEGAFDSTDEPSKNISLYLFGNCVCDTRDNPYGLILVPNTPEATEYIKSILLKIGSSKRIGLHSELVIM